MRVLLVGPLPPPNGGMALQTELLGARLRTEGHDVDVVAVNAPYRPRWTGRMPVLRALVRLIPYRRRLRAGCVRADLVHVLANSGWSWHLFSMPAIAAANREGVPVVLNYRGGLAREFFARSYAAVARGLRRCDDLIVPTEFLVEVFAERGQSASIVPNIVDLERFYPAPAPPERPHLVVTRNLEALYDNATALRAFALVLGEYPDATLTLTGEGPERTSLESLALELGIAAAVRFPGRLARDQVARLLREASLVLNPSTADNSPNSLIEAMACGVPIVSTDVGGIPRLCEPGRHALLVPAADPRAMADAARGILGEPQLRARLIAEGLARAADFAWPRVWEALRESYRRARAQRVGRAPHPRG